MSSFGVTLEGINVKTLEDVLQELDDDQRLAFGAAINTTPDSVLGQLNSVFGDKIVELWELAAAVYASQYPDSAQGAALDSVAAITGAFREAATKSQVVLSVNLDTGTTLTVGRVVSSSATGSRFATTEEVSNTTGASKNFNVAAESEEFGPIVAAAKTIDTIETPVSGWTAQAAIDSSLTEPFVLSDGQQLTMKVDGGAVQTAEFNTGEFVTIGAATAQEIVDVINAETTGLTAVDANGRVRIESDTDGPGSSIEITGGSANPQIGFSTDEVAGMNVNDATLGQNIESDSDFRVSREELLRLAGAATVEAIRSDILVLTGVDDVLVFENVTLVTDSDGVPGKAFEAVALAPATNALRSASLLSGNAETYDLNDGDTLIMKIDGGSTQTATFNTADFSDIDNATAAEVAVVINTDISGIVARAVTIAGEIYLEIKSDTTDTTSSIEITGGTGNYANLGFPETPTVAHGIDTLIAETIFASKAAGIQAYGTFHVAVQDSQGFYHRIGLSNPTEKSVEIQTTIVTDDDYPEDGDDQVAAALVAFGNTLSVSDDVVYERIKCEPFEVAGVVDITVFQIRFTGDSWGEVNLSVGTRELSTFDTSDVTVTSS